MQATEVVRSVVKADFMESRKASNEVKSHFPEILESEHFEWRAGRYGSVAEIHAGLGHHVAWVESEGPRGAGAVRTGSNGYFLAWVSWSSVKSWGYYCPPRYAAARRVQPATTLVSRVGGLAT